MTERLIVAAFAVWRLCLLLQQEPGFLDVGVHFRSFVQSRKALAPLGYCPKCLSVWLGALSALLLLTDYWPVLLPFALSGIAMVIDELVDRATDR